MDSNKPSSVSWKRHGFGACVLLIILTLVGVAYRTADSPVLTLRRGNPVKPALTVIASVPQSSREDFFTGLKKYAEDNRFRILIEKNPHFKESYDEDMRSDELWIIGDSLFDPLKFQLEFLPAPPQVAPPGVTTVKAEELVRALNQVVAVSAKIHE